MVDVVKKCHKGKLYSLSYLQFLRISSRLKSLSKCCPYELQRKCREIDLAHWKGTEYRTLLLYVGIVVFQGIVNENVRKHFMLLHFIVRFLCDLTHNVAYLPHIKSLCV